MENRLTIGRNGSVTANITAKELVVMGKLSGNVNVTERVDIRGEGSLTGDVVAQRLCIEDGACERKPSERIFDDLADPGHLSRRLLLPLNGYWKLNV
jgi:cytoskeletal protein CcmA (bactofilin family)